MFKVSGTPRVHPHAQRKYSESANLSFSGIRFVDTIWAMYQALYSHVPDEDFEEDNSKMPPLTSLVHDSRGF